MKTNAFKNTARVTAFALILLSFILIMSLVLPSMVVEAAGTTTNGEMQVSAIEEGSKTETTIAINSLAKLKNNTKI